VESVVVEVDSLVAVVDDEVLDGSPDIAPPHATSVGALTDSETRTAWRTAREMLRLGMHARAARDVP
jgi:hypothetical protein